MVGGGGGGGASHHLESPCCELSGCRAQTLTEKEGHKGKGLWELSI